MILLFIGDIVGSPGRRMICECLPQIIEEYQVDFTIANGENLAGGFGINRKIYDEMIDVGIDAFTMGNHVWDNKDIFNFIKNADRIVRPLNIHPDLPGCGSRIFNIGNSKILVIAVVGRTFMPPADCPFQAINEVLKEYKDQTDYIFVDIHAEATSEKMALGWYLDGRISALVGTHTHVQTNDSRIMPQGCGYLTDAGMTGPYNSVLGMDKDIVIDRFLYQMPKHFEPAQGDLQFNGVIFDLTFDGKCREIKLINFIKPSL